MYKQHLALNNLQGLICHRTKPKHIYLIYKYNIYLYIKRPIFLVINSQLFLLYNFSKFLYIFTLFIHPSTLNITDKTPHSPDDGSAKPKRYSVNWLCFSINPHFLFGLLVVNFSSQIVGLLSIIFFHLIYMYKEDLALNNLQWLICHKTKPNHIYWMFIKRI